MHCTSNWRRPVFNGVVLRRFEHVKWELSVRLGNKMSNDSVKATGEKCQYKSTQEICQLLNDWIIDTNMCKLQRKSHIRKDRRRQSNKNLSKWWTLNKNVRKKQILHFYFHPAAVSQLFSLPRSDSISLKARTERRNWTELTWFSFWWTDQRASSDALQ